MGQSLACKKCFLPSNSFQKQTTHYFPGFSNSGVQVMNSVNRFGGFSVLGTYLWNGLVECNFSGLIFHVPNSNFNFDPFLQIVFKFRCATLK